jgi:hypothetical protein
MENNRMNPYRMKLLNVLKVCPVVLFTLFIAASSTAQTSQTAPPLFKVTTDATLKGDGTSASPLGIKDSPTVSGSLTVQGDIQANSITSQFSSVSSGLTVTGPIQATTAVGDAIRATGGSAVTGSPGIGVYGTGGPGTGGSAGGRGVFGFGGKGTSGSGGYGVVGEGGQSDSSTAGAGMLGLGGYPSGTGVFGWGRHGDNVGGVGVSALGGLTILNGQGGVGLKAVGGQGRGAGHTGGIAIVATGGYGADGAATGLAGRFEGDVVITGNLAKGGGSFKIDHPLDPENKYLSHSFVESPDMMNIYNGNITTDANGDAVVELPEYFQALNRDFRYQLTVIGTFADSIVAEKITDNHFRIKTNLPNIEVSWQVTGVRQDAYANRNRIAVEEDKPAQERGLYLHPEAFNQPGDKSVWAQGAPKGKQ